MISAEQFLDILEEKDLLPPELIESLRKEVRQSKKPPGVLTLSQRLIRRKLLTPMLVQRLLTAAETAGPAEPGPATGKSAADDEELGLAPLEGEEVDEDDWKVAEAELQSGTGPAGKRPVKSEPPPSQSGLPKLGAGPASAPTPLDPLADANLSDSATVGLPLGAKRSRKKGLRGTLRGMWKQFWRRSRSKVVYVKPADPRKVRLMLITWGVALTLVSGVLVGFLHFSPAGPDELLRRADLAYDAASYAVAIQQYDAYLANYPRHPLAGSVRVRLGIARIRQALADSDDATRAFQVAQEVAPQVAQEESFQAFADELGLVLAAVAERWANQAQAQPDQDAVEHAREILTLLGRYVPLAAQPEQKVAEINARLVVSEGKLARDRDLLQAVADIGAAIGKGRVVEAYRVRNELVKQYAELADNAQLEQALAPASQAEQAAVRWIARRREAETAERPAAVLATVALTQRTENQPAPAAAGSFLFVNAEGAAYGLDAASGKVLWRRPLPAPASGPPAFLPVPLGPGPAQDVLLVDVLHNEILRVQGATGRLLWRHAAAQPVDLPPVLAGTELLLPSSNGRLEKVDLASGRSPGSIELPQPIRVPPTIDVRRGLVFQMADRANLYALSLADGACRQVLHLGHEPDGVAVPPAIAGNFLLVVINEGPREATLWALAQGPPLPPVARDGMGEGRVRGTEIERGVLDSPASRSVPSPGARGGTLVDARHDFANVRLTVAQKIRLSGRVRIAPAVDGNRVVLATGQSAFYALMLSAANPQRPLDIVAQTGPLHDEERLGSLCLRGTQFWMADTQLARYDILSEQGRIVPRHISDQVSTFLQPLSAIGQTLFAVRRKAGMAGVVASALDARKHEPWWDAHLAVPLADEPLVDAEGKTLTAVSALGSMFRIEAADLHGTTIRDAPTLAMDAGRLQQPIRHVTAMPDGMWAMTATSGAKQIIVYDPAEQPPRYRWLLLGDAMACPPILLGSGLLAPSRSGQVFLVDPRTTNNLADPFVPKLQALSEWTWRTPVAIGTQEAVLSDGDRRLYRLVFQAGPPPSLTAAEAMSAKPIVSPLAALGKVAYAVDNAAVLESFELPKLTQGKSHPLSGRLGWGPQRVGNYVLLATDKELLAIDERQELAWRVALPSGPLAGPPLAVGHDFVLAFQNGMLWRIAAATGREQGKIDVAVPLGTGPVLLNQRLVVGGRDGTVLEVWKK
ncbi:MAG: PQQ-binding-like beta-propeller repeat protein [Thermoguttaceae bacterium]|jgi:outer membrane protein assembly factor BamB